MLNWFVLKSGTVVGPISSEQVLSTYNNSSNMVWGVNCAEWLSFQEWSNLLSSGSFNTEVKIERTPMVPKVKELPEDKVGAKVFKIRPNPTEDIVAEKTTVQSAAADVHSGAMPLPVVSEVEKPVNIPPPAIPQVDDIFPNDPVLANVGTSSDEVLTEFNDSEISDIKLNEQLTDFLQDGFADTDGHTLIQATMDDLSHELDSENLLKSDDVIDDLSLEDGFAQVENINLEDSFPQVQNLDSEPSLDLEPFQIENEDGATKVQSVSLEDGFTQVQDLSLENEDGATKVQSVSLEDGFTQVQDLSLGNEDGATKVQSVSLEDGFTQVQDLSLENEDGATKVQSISLDDGFTQVQDLTLEDNNKQSVSGLNSENDFFNISVDNSSSVVSNSNSDEEPSDFFNPSDIGNSSFDSNENINEFGFGETKDSSASIDSLDKNEFFTLEESSDSSSIAANSDFESTVLELDSKYLEPDNTKIQINEIQAQDITKDSVPTIAEIIPVELEADKNLNSKIINLIDLNEKTNVADLKEIAQNIEQQKVLEKPIWYLAYDGESEGPMNVEALLKKLDQFKNPEFIYLWKQGMQDWQSLYDTPQISSQLGIGFRRHDRFPFVGTVKIEFKGNTQIGQLENLSLSGLGATGFGPLVLGERVKVTLDCPALDSEIEFVAEIRFTSDLGVLGLSYIKTEYAENINKLIELVKAESAQKAA
jgi:hypothetical protein